MRPWKYIPIIAFIFVSINIFGQQNFHTSNTNVDYAVETGALNLTTRLYTTSIEKAVNEKTTNKSSFESKLKNYIDNKVNLKINGKPVHLVYYGFQVTDQTTRIYMKADKINDIEALDIRFAILMDVYEDQQNFISIDIKNNRKKLVVRKENEILKVNFKS